MKYSKIDTSFSERAFGIDEGAMWEAYPWELHFNHECSELGGRPCKHCHSHKTKIHTRHDKSTWEEKSWTCPVVAIVANEGGTNSTGLCVECLIEAYSKIKEEISK